MEELEDIKIKFKGEEFSIRITTYSIGNNIKIQLFDKDELPFMTATTNVEHIVLNFDEVLIKNYSENEGILKALKEAGVIENITEKVALGYDYIHICKLL